MKEHWKLDEKQLAALEEGILEGKRQEQTKKLDHGNNPYTRQHFHLILFLGWMLFCGLCFYLTYQNLSSKRVEAHISDTIRETLRELMYESRLDMRGTQPDTETSVIFVKPEVIINKPNNLVKEADLIKEQDMKQHEASAADESTYASSSINESNNVVRASDNDGLSTMVPDRRLLDSHDDGIHVKELEEILTRKSITNKHGNINVNDAESFFQEPAELHDTYMIPENLISDVEGLEVFNRNNRNIFTTDNHLTLNNHENAPLSENAPNKLENPRSDVIIISNFNDPSDVKVKDASQDDRTDSNSFADAAEQNVPDLKIFYPSLFRKFPEPSEYDDSLIFAVTQRPTEEQIENKPSHDTTNEDRHEDDDERNFFFLGTFMPGRVSLLDLLFNPRGNVEDAHSLKIEQERTEEDEKYEPMISVENAESQHSLKIGQENTKEDDKYEPMISTENTENQMEQKSKIEPDTKEDEKYEPIADAENAENQENTGKDEKHDSTENMKDFEFWFAPPTEQDSIYPWTRSEIKDSFKPSDNIADDQRLKSKDTSRSSETSKSSSSLHDDIEMIGDSRNLCKLEIISGIVTVKCPAINFNEEWNLTSTESSTSAPPVDILHGSESFENIYDDYYIECDENTASQSKDELNSNENSKRIATSRRSDTSGTVESEESGPSVKMSNEALSKSLETHSFANAKDSQDDAIYIKKEQLVPPDALTTRSSFDKTVNRDERWNLFKTADTQEKSNEDSRDSDFTNNENAKTLTDERTLERELAAIFDDEMYNFRKYREAIHKSVSTEEYAEMCNFFSLMCERPLIFDLPIASRKTAMYPDDSVPIFRKKRMADNLTWKQEVSNMLKEKHETANLLQNLERVYRKMEILAACIDRLHERYLLHNKLDDDYISKEFSRNIEKGQVSRK